jgi:murein L,D-transpeptidase YcbB/YkuD
MKQTTAAERKGMAALLLALFLLSACSDSAKESSPVRMPDSNPGTIIQEILTGRSGGEIVIEGETIYSLQLVRSFYQARSYRPAWSQDGRLMQAATLIKAVEESYADGLTPGYYHLSRLKSLVASVEKEPFPAATHLGNVDILLSDAFITLGCHLSGGCVDPVTMKAEWFAARGRVDVASLLEQALRKKDVRETLARLRPVQAAYENLKQVLAKYRGMSLHGPWPQVPAGPPLKKGVTSARVAELRKRLAASGDLDAGRTSAVLFDEPLETAVRTFQGRHGLEPDGVAGRATLAALNVPLAERMRQIELNLERLRWILGNTERRFIIVNIADFHLKVVEDGKPVLSMKVVVGKSYLQTPVFTAKMKYLIINPVWNVPDSIARKEILKDIRKNPRYLSEQNMNVLRGWGDQEEEVDPETVDWSHVSPRSLPYRFRQEPGPLNPLGRIKFMFPNSFDVYLHDTPSKGLFARSIRAFSHGCIRIEKPIELAEYLLGGSPNWSREKILSAVKKGVETEVPIPHPLNVHFIYLTAWVDENDTLQFRNDIYGRDKILDEILGGKPAS